MKLPNLNEQNVRLVGHFYNEQHPSGQVGIHPTGIFGDIFGGIGDVLSGAIGKVPCVLSKAGPKGVACLTQCGPNPACLATCAGPSVVSAILGCL